MTPLHIACQHGQCHAVEALIEAGADVRAVDDRGETPLHWIVKLRYPDADLQSVRNVRAELHNGHAMAARILMQNGAEVDAQSHKTGRTALHDAVQHGWTDVARVLILEGSADFKKPGLDDTTPWSLAARQPAMLQVRGRTPCVYPSLRALGRLMVSSPLRRSCPTRSAAQFPVNSRAHVPHPALPTRGHDLSTYIDAAA